MRKGRIRGSRSSGRLGPSSFTIAAAIAARSAFGSGSSETTTAIIPAAIRAKANIGPARPTNGSTNSGATAGPMMVPRPKAPGQPGHGVGALVAVGALGDIGLGRRVRRRAEQAEQGAREEEEHEDQDRRHQVPHAGADHQGAGDHRDHEAEEPHQHQRLAAPPVGRPRPERRAERPQQGREREDRRHQIVGEADLAADGRQHRLHAGVADGGHQRDAEDDGEQLGRQARVRRFGHGAAVTGQSSEGGRKS